MNCPDCNNEMEDFGCGRYQCPCNREWIMGLDGRLKEINRGLDAVLNFEALNILADPEKFERMMDENEKKR